MRPSLSALVEARAADPVEAVVEDSLAVDVVVLVVAVEALAVVVVVVVSAVVVAVEAAAASPGAVLVVAGDVAALVGEDVDSKGTERRETNKERRSQDDLPTSLFSSLAEQLLGDHLPPGFGKTERKERNWALEEAADSSFAWERKKGEEGERFLYVQRASRRLMARFIPHRT